MFITGVFVETAIIENTVIVESKAEVASLGRVTDLGKAICKHRFCDTINKRNVTNLYIAFDHVMFDVEMSNPSEFVRVTSKEFGACGIGVHSVGFGGLNMKEFKTFLDIFEIFDARRVGEGFSISSGVDHQTFLHHSPGDRSTIE
jgi:hypothetical protein